MDINISLPGIPFENFPSVDSMAALRLRASTSLTQGDGFRVNGENTVGDGGGNVFAWDALSTEDDNGTTVIRPNDRAPLQAGRWKSIIGEDDVGIEEAPANGNYYARRNKSWVAFTPGGGSGGGGRQLINYPGSTADGETPNNEAFQLFVDDGGGLINWQADPYVLDAQINVPDDCMILVEEGVRIVWTGAVAPVKTGVFQLGSNVTFGGANWTVSAPGNDPSRYVFESAGKSNIEIHGLNTVGLQHTFFHGTTETYASVVTSGSPNIGRGLRITGGSVKHGSAIGGEGSIFVLYSQDFAISGVNFENANIGVQVWGGDSNFGGNGNPANERKSGRGTIENCRFNQAGGTSQAWVFTSMAQDVLVSDCLGRNASDVGYDAEGSINVTFTNCNGRDATNGVFATFFYARNVTFNGCKGFSTTNKSLIYLNNSSLDSAFCHSVTYRNCEFIAEGTSVVELPFETVAHLNIENCTFQNCRINSPAINNFSTTIKGNKFIYTQAFPAFDSIYLAGTNPIGTGAEPTRHIADNTWSSPDQNASSRAIVISDADFNASPQVMITNNLIPSFPIAVRTVWSGASPASAMNVLIMGNVLQGTIEKADPGAGSLSVVNKVNNYTLTGTLIP